MTQYRFTWPYAMDYPFIGLRVQPDEVIERDENPDPNRFEEVSAPKAKTAPPTPDPKETD